LRLLKPGVAPGQELVIDEVRYESKAPWPTLPDGFGPSLQLVDPAQDNNRVANWAVMSDKPQASGPRWRYVSASGTASSSTLYIYLTNPGEAYIDDIKLVAGSVAESGPNLLVNGDFESGLSTNWAVSQTFSGSDTSTTARHGGLQSLHLVSSGAGSSRNTSVYQDILPYLTLGEPYTLSYSYLENPAR